jgi:hypothetical protein
MLGELSSPFGKGGYPLAGGGGFSCYLLIIYLPLEGVEALLDLFHCGGISRQIPTFELLPRGFILCGEALDRGSNLRWYVRWRA